MLTPGQIQSMYALVPNQKQGTLADKIAFGTIGTADTFSTPRTVNYRKRVPTRTEIVRGNFSTEDIVSAFSILDDGSDPSFSPPTMHGRFVDVNGEAWIIRVISDKCMETLHAIVCTKAWVATS